MTIYRRIDQLSPAATPPAATDLIEGERDPDAPGRKSEKWTVDLLAQSTAFTSRYAGGGGGGGSGSLDGGNASSTYGGTTAIDGGGA